MSTSSEWPPGTQGAAHRGRGFPSTRLVGMVVDAVGSAYFPSSVANVAPWFSTVAASSIGRGFQTMIELGKAQKLAGFGLNSRTMNKAHPLIAAIDTSNGKTLPREARFCNYIALNPIKFEGKIVFCERDTPADDFASRDCRIKQGGGAGLILNQSTIKEVGYLFRNPAAAIDDKEARTLFEYMNDNRILLLIVDSEEDNRRRRRHRHHHRQRRFNPGLSLE